MKTQGVVLAAALIVASTAVLHAEDEDEIEERHKEEHHKKTFVFENSGGPGPMERGRKGPREGLDPEMRERMEKLHALKTRSRELARKMRQAKDEEKAAVKAEAKKVLEELFDAKLAMEESRLGKMEKHLAEMKNRLEKRKASREQLIERRLEELSGDVETWD